jgi:hypothetical protein
MNTITENKVIPTAYDLKHEVEQWVNQFNFVQVGILEKASDDMLLRL